MFEHFSTAQDPIYPAILDELRSGRKHGHWMWFVFPQLRALGSSPTAQRYGLADLAEARAYLSEPMVGPRLLYAVAAALQSGETDPTALFGSPDDLKFRSSLTLFRRAAIAAGLDTAPFDDALLRFYDGAEDPLTLQLLGFAREPATLGAQ